MLGSIVGDVVGSIYEWNNLRDKRFELFSTACFFTDDSVLTAACADAILNGTDFGAAYMRYGRGYPRRGYGGRFARWLDRGELGAYGSFGNGSAMRAAPCGWAGATREETLLLAESSAAATHDHPEGIKGAQAVALAVFMGRSGASKKEIREAVCGLGYDLGFTIDAIRPFYKFNETCQGTVPQAVVAFLESSDFEDAIRTAVSVGGDTDTLACITGGIAEAYYGGVPGEIRERTLRVLDEGLRGVVRAFEERYAVSGGAEGPGGRAR